MDIAFIACVLILLGCFCTVIYKNNILNPAFGFTMCFVPQLIYSLFWVKQWQLDLYDGTFWVLLLSPILFVAISVFLSTITRRTTGIRGTKAPKNSKAMCAKPIKTGSLWLLLSIAIQAVILLALVRFLLSLGVSGNLSTAIYFYRHSNLFTEDKISLPKIISFPRQVSIATAYFYSYLLAHSVVYQYKGERLLLLINIILGAANDIILGGRTGSIQILVAFFVQIYFLNGSKNGWQSQIKVTTILKVIAGAVVAVTSFVASTNWLGRNSTQTPAYYLAIYLSAQIKNLDTFIRSGNFGADMSQTQTLLYVANYLSGKFSFTQNWAHELDIPFHRVQGYSLGNVCTTYYGFLYDGGYVAVAGYVALMAIICHVLYTKAMKDCQRNSISIWLMVYSYVYFSIVLSFFSPKFYEQVFNPRFVKMVFFWVLIKFGFQQLQKVNIKGINHTPKNA